MSVGFRYSSLKRLRCNKLNVVWCRYMIPKRKMKCLLFVTAAFTTFCYFVCKHYDFEVDGWNRNTPRHAVQYILPNKSTTLIKPFDMCESPLFLLVVVCSSTTNLLARNAIRFTWALDKNFSNSVAKVYFLMGKTKSFNEQRIIEKESRIYHDIIQEDFVDTYSNLTIKSLRLLKVIKRYCADSVRFVLKTDDDVFVMTKNLVHMLNDEKSTQRLLIGHKHSRTEPFRSPRHKWYTSKYMYSGDMYPDYLSGSAYVMSIDTVLLLLETALRTPIFHFEDVYLTGICSELADIEPRDNPNFYYNYYKVDTCKFRTLITEHDYRPFDMVEKYLLLKSLEDELDELYECSAYRKPWYIPFRLY